MNASARILVVDDNDAMRKTIAIGLRAAGHRVLEAANGQEGLDRALAEQPDLIVLDVAMPRLNGLEMARELRRLGKESLVLMLTTHQQMTDRLDGFAAGADDYLAKPFDRRELCARVDALLRRRLKPPGAGPRLLWFDQLRVDLDQRQAARGDAIVSLTPTEWSLLELFAGRLNIPISRELMLDAVWGYTYFPSTRTIDTHIWRLRAKLGDRGAAPRWLKKVQGEGYVLTGLDPAPSAPLTP